MFQPEVLCEFPDHRYLFESSMWTNFMPIPLDWVVLSACKRVANMFDVPSLATTRRIDNEMHLKTDRVQELTTFRVVPRDSPADSRSHSPTSRELVSMQIATIHNYFVRQQHPPAGCPNLRPRPINRGMIVVPVRALLDLATCKTQTSMQCP